MFPVASGLIGFDVTGWTKIAVPEISAIMIPAYQEGQIASRKLIEMIESKNSISNKKSNYKKCSALERQYAVAGGYYRMIQIKVLDAEKNIVAENGGQEEVNLTLRREYQEGDTIVI